MKENYVVWVAEENRTNSAKILGWFMGMVIHMECLHMNHSIEPMFNLEDGSHMKEKKYGV